jgi:hypothetical protein
LHKLETEQSQLQLRMQEVQAAHAAADLVNSSCQEMLSLVKDQQMELVQVWGLCAGTAICMYADMHCKGSSGTGIDGE